MCAKYILFARAFSLSLSSCMQIIAGFVSMGACDKIVYDDIIHCFTGFICQISGRLSGSMFTLCCRDRFICNVEVGCILVRNN